MLTTFVNESHEKHDLHQGWKVRLVKGEVPSNLQVILREGVEAEVPGSICLDLMRHHLIPDPFFAENEKKAQWVSECDWEYSLRFQLDETWTPGEKNDGVQIVFEGLDTIAELYLDGDLLATPENMFHSHRFDLPKSIKPGAHKLSVLFRSPREYIRKCVNEMGDIPDSFGGSRGWIRKAPYSFGWDWGPDLPGCGIWKPVYLQRWGGGRIGFYTTSFHGDERQGTLRTHVECLLESDILCRIAFELQNGTDSFSTETVVSPRANGSGVADLEMTIDNPALWYPANLGKPELYTATMRLMEGDETLHEISEKIGLRTIELKREKDQWGESFDLMLNGRRIILKGANWIPNDSFLPRVKQDRIRTLFQQAVDANMNMLRVWGGGIYESPEFYRLADEMGLLIWQDFPFACAFYPEEREFLANVRKEAETAVSQLARHPSLALWCGNNEIEMDADRLERVTGVSCTGGKIWNQILPEVLQELSPGVPYIPTSPFGGETPNSLSHGTRHAWNVWSGWEPVENYPASGGRFVTEFGFQAPPSPVTLRKVLSKDQQFIQSREFEWHNKQIEGTERLFKYIATEHRVRTGFDEFIRLAQDIQGRALRFAIEQWRLQYEKISGALIWQLNDCWPVTSWSIIDYNLLPKAAWFQVRRAFRKQTLVWKEENGGNSLYAINENDLEWTGQVVLRSFSLEGRELEKRIIPLNLPSADETSSPVHLLLSDERNIPERIMVAEVSSSQEEGGYPVRAVHYPVKIKHLSLPEPRIKMEAINEAENHVLKIKSDTFTPGVWIEEKSDQTVLIRENAMDLLPGDSFNISLEFREKETLPSELIFSLWSAAGRQ